MENFSFGIREKYQNKRNCNIQSNRMETEIENENISLNKLFFAIFAMTTITKIAPEEKNGPSKYSNES